MRRRRSRRQLVADVAHWKWRTSRALERAEEAEAENRRLRTRLAAAGMGDTVPMAAVHTPSGWQPASSAPIPVPVEAPTEVLARVVDGDGPDEMVLPWGPFRGQRRE
jgi:hypothetical protein